MEHCIRGRTVARDRGRSRCLRVRVIGCRNNETARLRYGHDMTLVWEQTIIDARNPVALGRWWCEALGWVVVNDDPDEFEIRESVDQTPGLLFAQVDEAKVAKNRLHLDFRPDDQVAEVDRLERLGAVRADVGQGEQTWVVLVDPEGNEFCVLRSHNQRP
jgi:hypothetical protein